MRLINEYIFDVEHRFKYVIWTIIIVFLLILLRLYALQIAKGGYYRRFSQENSIKETRIPALRGMIFDRNHNVIVDNRPAFDIVVTPQYVAYREKMVRNLAEILSMDADTINFRLKTAENYPSYHPIIIKSDVSHDEMANIRANKTLLYTPEDEYDLRGVDVVLRYTRLYPEGDTAPHLLGYVRQLDEEGLKKYQERRLYKVQDEVGITGIEEYLDASLRGEDGYYEKVVNAIGREVNLPDMELAHQGAEDGSHVYLTIDSELQRLAKTLLGERAGAVVALDPRDGSVLALYSSPAFDLNQLSSSEGSDYWQRLWQTPGNIFLNRATNGTYPPGSTFKIVTALAALSEGVVRPDEKIHCGGGLTIGNRRFQCWKEGGHGDIAIREAIAESCDTFFYTLGLRLGPDKLAKYAEMFGLAKPTGIDLPGEKSGIVADSKWKETVFHEKWRAGDSISQAIGQGLTTVTPLQNAVLISAIANGGHPTTPHVVQSIISADGTEIYRWDQTDHPSNNLLEMPAGWDKNIKVIQDGLKAAVASEAGTAHGLNRLGLKIAGKTGTAQVIGRESLQSMPRALSRGATRDPQSAMFKDHAWFVGYAPYDNPKIAVAAIVEHGGFGASAAAPIVGAIIKASEASRGAQGPGFEPR